jgi:hypothetical protein
MYVLVSSVYRAAGNGCPMSFGKSPHLTSGKINSAVLGRVSISIRPALDRFERALAAEQKTRLDEVLHLSLPLKNTAH